MCSGEFIKQEVASLVQALKVQQNIFKKVVVLQKGVLTYPI
jgi:hypothetical protein